MTGFARVDGRVGNKAWIWELKSVNGRGLELRFRLPPGFDAIEAELRSQAQARLVRGNVNLNLNFIESAEAAPAYRLNEALLEQLHAHWDEDMDKRVTLQRQARARLQQNLEADEKAQEAARGLGWD